MKAKFSYQTYTEHDAMSDITLIVQFNGLNIRNLKVVSKEKRPTWYEEYTFILEGDIISEKSNQEIIETLKEVEPFMEAA